MGIFNNNNTLLWIVIIVLVIILFTDNDSQGCGCGCRGLRVSGNKKPTETNVSVGRFAQRCQCVTTEITTLSTLSAIKAASTIATMRMNFLEFFILLSPTVVSCCRIRQQVLHLLALWFRPWR